MNGDSFIYLDKRFVNYLYDNSLCNDPLLKISDWLGGSKTDYAFDRTNTIQGPLREKNISPIPEFDINFNKTFKEICDRYIQHACDLVQTTSRDAVDATFVFMGLLVRDADHVGHLLLAQPQHDAAFTDTRAYMPVD